MTSEQNAANVLAVLRTMGKVARATYRGGKTISNFGDTLFRTRPEDFEAQRRAENQRNRDIYFEMATRRERQRRGL